MFYHLLVPLTNRLSFLNVFRYITFRSAYAMVTALLICFVLGAWVIRRLKAHQVRETIRDDGPRTHLSKEGTPTMGGIIVLFGIVVPTLLWADLSNPYVQLVLLSTVWLGIVGFIDDYLKAIKKMPKGLVGHYKLAGQIALGLVVGSFLYVHPITPQWATMTEVPFFKEWVIDLSWLYIPFVVFVITGTSNAVNLTDGLDGLAIGLFAIAAAAFGLVSYVSGRVDFSAYLDILYLPGSGELSVFCLAAVGAALGFLWFNSHPAQVFMGDTGALALGGALGTLAVLLKKEFLLLIIGGVFVAETMSVIIQRIYFKYYKRRTGTGRRVFRMAPLHHHFELLGWPESKVVARFWIVGILLALLSLSTFKIR